MVLLNYLNCTETFLNQTNLPSSLHPLSNVGYAVVTYLELFSQAIYGDIQ